MSLLVNSWHEEESEPATCKVCGCELEWIDCCECAGEGEFDEYDDDPINYGPGEEYTDCQLCRGHGGWLECPNVSKHVKEQP